MDKLLPTLLLVAGGAAVWYLTRNQRNVAATPTQIIVSSPTPNVTGSGSDGMYDFLTSLSGNVAGVATSYIENVARYEISPEESVRDSSSSALDELGRLE